MLGKELACFLNQRLDLRMHGFQLLPFFIGQINFHTDPGMIVGKQRLHPFDIWRGIVNDPVV